VYVTGQNFLLRQIVCKDLNTGETQMLRGGSGLNMQPKIDGDLLVWSGGATFTGRLMPECTSVFIRNVATSAQQVLRARSDTSSFSHPAVSGNKVVWVQHAGIDKNNPEKWYNMPYDICGADVSDLKKPKYFTIATGVGRCDPFPLSNLASEGDIVSIGDDMVVWEGDGNIQADPCFVSLGRWVGGDSAPSGDQPAPDAVWWVGDYHLQSEGLRWDSRTNSWVSDAATSPCIDAGDPASPLLDEPVKIEQPGGQEYVNVRIDMGAYGGTAEASLAPPAGG